MGSPYKNNIFAEAGFSDKKLKRLAKRPFWEKGMAPWHAWESERTGFGLGLRVGGFYPPFLPLFLKSDHYANPITEIRENEGVGNETGIYLTWNPVKARKMNKAGFETYCIKHPWRYLHLPRYPRTLGNGTLLFLPHSHDSFRSSFDWDKVKTELERIPERALPVTVCLGEQDIKRGLLEEVRENLGLPVVSAGELTSQLFPFRLWRLFRNYAFTAGFDDGSHAIYAIWSGRSHLLLGDGVFSSQKRVEDGQWEESSIDEGFMRDYDVEEVAREMKQFLTSLRTFRTEPSQEEINLVEKWTNSNDSLSQSQLSGLLWRSILRWRLPRKLTSRLDNSP